MTTINVLTRIRSKSRSMRARASAHPSLLRLPAVAGVAAILALAGTSVSSAAEKGSSNGRNIFGISVGGDIAGLGSMALKKELDAIEAAGARWLRMDINWAQIQDHGPTRYEWGPVDKVVKGATARGIKVLGVIEYTPRWARPPGTPPTHGPDPATYANFARKAAAHYSALGVHAYEVWNEPNIPGFWTPRPDPAHYTRLLRAAYPAIKQADPKATVLTGGTAPAFSDGTTYWPTDWLLQIYANGGGGYFDAVANHPYCFPTRPGQRVGSSAWYLMYGSHDRYTATTGGEGGGRSMRAVMIANGDGEKKIWGTEFGAPSGGPVGIGGTAQAQTIREGYSRWEKYNWAGPLFTYEVRDYGTDASTSEHWFGLLRHDFSKKPAFRAYRAVARGR